jgi:MipA family protein
MKFEACIFPECKLTGVVTAFFLTGVVGLAFAQPTERAADKNEQGPWAMSVGGGVISKPDYEGSKKSISGILPTLSATYRTADYGKVGLDPITGLSWTPVEKDAYSFGVGLGFDFGRKDNANGTVFQPGSKLLSGMGRIKSSTELNVFGHYTLGVPVYAALTKGLSEGKVNVLNRDQDGHGGTRLELGVEVPWKPTNELTLKFAPNLVWADKKYLQAYFGVTSVQAVTSNYKAYTPDGGIKSAGLNARAEYKLDRHWTGVVDASFNQLRGSAAKSPLVSAKGQTSVFAGVTYAF